MDRNNSQHKTKTRNTLITKQDMQNKETNIKQLRFKKPIKLIRTKQREKDVMKEYVFPFRNIYR